MQVVAHDVSTLNVQYYSDLFIIRALGLAGYVILVQEALEALPDEIKYIWPARWSTVKVLYLTNRYGSLVSLGASTLQVLGIWRSSARRFCYEATLAMSLMQFGSFASVHVLVLLRAWATWGRHIKILAILVALFVSYAVTSISILVWGIVSAGYDAYPMASVVGTCISAVPHFAWVLWIPSLALECAVFVLTMVSIQKFDLHLQLAWQSPIVRVIMRDAILYFSLTLFSGLFNILIWAYYADRALNMLANNFTLCLMIVAGQRLVLDLRKISPDDTLSTTRIGREVERAIEGVAAPSPIVFAERDTPTESAPPSPSLWSRVNMDWGAVRGLYGHVPERSASLELVEVVVTPALPEVRRTWDTTLRA